MRKAHQELQQQLRRHRRAEMAKKRAKVFAQYQSEFNIGLTQLRFDHWKAYKANKPKFKNRAVLPAININVTGLEDKWFSDRPTYSVTQGNNA